MQFVLDKYFVREYLAGREPSEAFVGSEMLEDMKPGDYYVDRHLRSNVDIKTSIRMPEEVEGEWNFAEWHERLRIFPSAIIAAEEGLPVCLESPGYITLKLYGAPKADAIPIAILAYAGEEEEGTSTADKSKLGKHLRTEG